MWSPKGRELFYRNGDAVMVVPVRLDPGFSLETPKILFKGNYYSNISIVGPTWDVSPDGKRFLMLKGSDTRTGIVVGPRKINIVVNWFEELKQRVPTK